MGKIMLNGVTYSGTIYEASDIESGQGVEWLPATRVVYDDEITKLSANSAQTAIEKLKQLNDELSEKVPFSLAYNASTQEYGYMDRQGKFIPFKQDDGPSKGGDRVKVFPEGNGTTPIAQIKINDEYYTILGYGDSLVFKGHIAEDTLPEVNIKTKPTKNWIMISDEDKTYTYIVKNDYTEEEQELTLKTKKGDVVYSDGSNWSILFSTYTNEDEYSIIYLSEIEDGQIVGNLKVNEKEYPILVPSISGVRFEKVNSYADLPNPGVEGTIYLVLKESGEESNIYTEYIWVANGETGVYEMLGDTAVKAVDIEVSAIVTEGTKIASIEVDGEVTDLYSPDITSVNISTEGSTDKTIRFGITEDGQYGYYKDGADTVTPFSEAEDFTELILLINARTGYDDDNITDAVLHLLAYTAAGGFYLNIEKINEQYSIGFQDPYLEYPHDIVSINTNNGFFSFSVNEEITVS